MIIRFDLKKVLGFPTARLMLENLPKHKGQSYLINYDGLKEDYRFYSPTDVVNYIILASYRDYNYSMSFTDFSLPWDVANMSISEIDRSKLFWHHNKRIFFKFEEEKASTLGKRNKYGN